MESLTSSAYPIAQYPAGMFMYELTLLLGHTTGLRYMNIILPESLTMDHVDTVPSSLTRLITSYRRPV